jgi:hypothetical protein
VSDDPKPDANGQAPEPPAPEELQEQTDATSDNPQDTESGVDSPAIQAVKEAARRRRGTYRPSHKATFVGLGVVAGILILNAIGLAFILRSNQAQAEDTKKESVTLSAKTLNGLGVSRNAVGSDGVELTVNPNTQFGGTVVIAGNTTISGQLKLNNKFVAAEGAFVKLQGGDTSLEKLNVNGDATISNLNLRKDLVVAGTARIQGQLTVSQLMTVNNNLNITGSLSVGGTFATKSLSIGSLTVSGHIITTGPTPPVSAGGAAGSNGTVSVSGNDTSGTIAVNIGVGATSGTLVNLTFSNQFGSTPHVVVTAVGRSASGFYINRTSAGFSIVTPNALASGGYSFDYIVMQ